MPGFVALTLEGIEEGRFLRNANFDFAEVMRKLVTHVEKYGPEKADGAQAELTIKIKVKFEGRGANDYSVKATTAQKLPGRPAFATIAMSADEQDGQKTLWVREAGSSADHPRQQKLATDDGRDIDPKSGKAKGTPPEP